ncbi:sensor histidine kinase [Actinomadura miaoliensis]|uniref:Signal transduction histidine kinase subgroup 3 dimerisation and phosphoacceptor domain-containing protein n=1 Tax=Actinomadura miaoliensis TaxID=430685 RepID=A0ABP7WRC4_9ACTN
MQATPTTADLEARAASRFAQYRKITDRSFLLALFGMAVPVVVALMERSAPPPLLAVATAGAALQFVLYMRLVRAGLAGRVPWRDIAVSGVLAAALAWMTVTSPVWAVIGPFWASGVAVCLSSHRWLVALSLGGGVYWGGLTTLAVHADGRRVHWFTPPIMIAIYVAVFAMSLYANLVLKRMWEMHQEAHAAREAQARLAVAEERLRFSRDLHDLLGHSLSLIAVKSELAMRLAERDPERARAEMADVRGAARSALREVRAAVRGYREVELDAELAGVRAVLEAAGVRCTAGPPPPGLPPEVGSTLAWVIREGATNVIKHSTARTCRVSVVSYGGSVVLEMTNDGARPGRGEGSGLTGLSERVGVLGGTLTAGPHGRDGFLLRAVVPLGEDA